MARGYRKLVTERVRRFSNSAYTGRNRCRPCTILNLALLGIAVVVTAPVSWIAAAGLTLAGGAAIALRGYLIPYTPVLVPALTARLPWDISKEPAPHGDASFAAADVDGEAVLEALLAADVLRGEADLVLDDTFRTEWHEQIEQVCDGDVATALEATLPDATVERYDWRGNEWFALEGPGSGVESQATLARPVAIADVAAVRALTDRGVPIEAACGATRPLRQYLSICPVCDRDLAVTNAACCGGYGPDGPDQVLACEACETQFFALDEV